jgi:N-succinyldiaminopimelate aminotransferase
MSLAVQAASVAAWNDEAHVVENRRLYAAKFAQATPIIQRALRTQRPDAGFFLWAATPIDDEVYARRLYAECHVKVLPGTYLSREQDGLTPGKGFIRIALVASSVDEVVQAARRIAELKI